MLNETAEAGRGILKTATRPLEVIELFALRRRPLSVSEIADALDIPQSSSSVLLKAMNGAGFVARDRHTRKYLPSVRSLLLGDWAHDASGARGGLLEALDALSLEARADVRLGIRNGVHVQYAHVSAEHRDVAIRPGMKLPIAQDALGRMLLLAEPEPDMRRIVRHANAVAGIAQGVDVTALAAELKACRRDGFALRPDFTRAAEMVLAIALPARFGAPAAIGLGLAAARLPAERPRLLGLLRDFAARIWEPGPDAAPPHRPGRAKG